MTDEEFVQKCNAVIEMSKEKDRLEEEIKKTKAKLVEKMGGEKLLLESGFELRIKHTIRDTPQIAAINEKLKVNLTFETAPECFKRSEYDSLTVKKMIVEG